MAIELHIGPRWGGPGDWFADEAHARRVYARHRDRLLERYLSGYHPGDRPEAYWLFGAPPEVSELHGSGLEAYHRRDAARLAWLHQTGQLTAAERAAILAEAAKAVVWLQRAPADDLHGNTRMYERRLALGQLLREPAPPPK
jgi:hypothetical protein